MGAFSNENEERREDEIVDPDVTQEIEVSKTRNTDNVGQTSVEIDVENLIAELEAEKSASGVDSDGDLRKRLDEILEKKQTEEQLHDDFEDYELED